MVPGCLEIKIQLLISVKSMSDIYDWCVIGAGVAGICMIARLLDNNIPAKKIVWIDPDYSVGDLGKYWHMVPSNTDVGLLLKSLAQSRAFSFNKSNQRFSLQDSDPNKTIPLIQLVQPLQEISDNLRKQVLIYPGCVSKLSYEKNWQITIQNTQQVLSKNVVLATGSEPNAPLYDSPNFVPLTTALDPEKLATSVNYNDNVLVFGSSHSAILVMKNLVDSGVGKIVNVFRTHLIYAEKHGDKIKYDNTGLKGIAAIWAKSHIEIKLLDNISRYHIDEVDIGSLLKESTKQIYATGFHRRKNITADINLNNYNVHTALIDTNIYGIGIAYPLMKEDHFGIKEYKVGLDSFLSQADYIIDQAL